MRGSPTKPRCFAPAIAGVLAAGALWLSACSDPGWGSAPGPESSGAAESFANASPDASLEAPEPMPDGLRRAFITQMQGNASPAFHAMPDPAHGGGASWRAENPIQRYAVVFDGAGASVSSLSPAGSVHATLAATGFGCDNELEQLREGTPVGSGNRVAYARFASPAQAGAPITEWFVNGPLGLEQGFDIPTPPSCLDDSPGTLAVEVALSGDFAVVPSLREGGVELVDRDGRVLATYNELSAEDGSGGLLPSRMEIVNGRVRLLVEVRHDSFPVRIDPLLAILDAKLLPYNKPAGQRFGASVAVDGYAAAVGVPFDELASPTASKYGSVHVFELWANGQWRFQAKLTAADRAVGDEFGSAVSIFRLPTNENRVVVGAPKKATSTGAVYVFEGSGIAYTQTAKLTATAGAAGDAFGTSVSVGLNTVMVGAPLQDTKAVNAGAIYAFYYNGASWSQQARLVASDGAQSDSLGQSVAFWESGGITRALAGAPNADHSAATDVGAAYVYTRSGSTWTQQAKLIAQAADLAAFDKFGSSVSGAESLALVGAPGTSAATGKAFSFAHASAVWGASQRINPTDSPRAFGSAVAFDGKSAVIGAPGAWGGIAYYYERIGSSWISRGQKFSSNGPGAFGNSVGVSGDRSMVADSVSDSAGTTAGAVDFYRRTAVNWEDDSRFDARGSLAWGGMGTCVAVKGDLLAAGGGFSEAATNSGEIFLFKNTSQGWTRLSRLVSTDAAGADGLGQACDIGLDSGGNTAVLSTAVGRRAVYIFTEGAVGYTQSAKVVPSGTGKLLPILAASGTTWLVATQAPGKVANIHVVENLTSEKTVLAASSPVGAFGTSADIDKDIIVVGSADDQVYSASGGAAFVFLRSGSVWTELQKLQPSDPSSGNHFGSSVAVWGDTIVVAARGAQAAYVFRRSGSTWTQDQKLVPPESAPTFGAAVDIDGDEVAVSAPQAFDSGMVYVFLKTKSTWEASTVPPVGPTLYFGSSLALSRAALAVGAPYDGEGAHRAGAVFVYNLPREAGDPCDATVRCVSGYCVDGVCCATACTGVCLACSAALKQSGADGECGPMKAGSDPDSDCSTQDPCLQNGWCDGAGACQLWASGTACGTAQCISGNRSAVQHCSGSGTCSTDPSGTLCDPYICALGTCTTQCANDNGCVESAYCDESSLCVPRKANSAACGAAGECISGYCVDGVCCNTACTDLCQACAAGLKQSDAGSGTCGPAKAGSDPRGQCPDDGTASCQRDGMCDGVGACRLYGPSAVCAPAVCEGNQRRLQHCSGTGACQVDSTGADCGTYACADGACPSTCAADSHCSLGNYCTAQKQCVPKLALGATCESTTQCASGFCVDAVCCNTSCGDLCQACSAALKESGTSGTCGPAKSGTDPHGQCPDDGAMTCGKNGLCDGSGACEHYGTTTTCGASYCDGNSRKDKKCDGAGECASTAGTSCGAYACLSGGACATTCASDAQCAPDHWCNTTSTMCQPKQADGAACAASAQCSSGYCVDGVCCNQACTGTCSACSQAKKGGGADGDCGAVVAGSDPDDECVADPSATCGTDGMCNGQGACRTTAAGTPCGATQCNAGVVSGQTCDGLGACKQNSVGTSCSPYLCAGSACATTCATDANCFPDAFCSSTSQCVTRKAAGQACAVANECTSGFCVDGVCCQTSCTSPCMTCAAALKESSGSPDGECAPAKESSDPHDDCEIAAPSSCGNDGFCNGAGACRRYAPTQTCGASQCIGNLLTGQLCDGLGNCQTTGANQDCAPYLCSNGACGAMCATDLQCAKDAWCNDAGECRPKQAAGAPCETATACTSGQCADGVCCDTACGGQCEACNEVGSLGTCTPVTGAPRGDRPGCAGGTNECAGSCDGEERMACAYPGSVVSCGSSCSGGFEVRQTCSGNGTCLSGAASPCAPFVCEGGSACKTSCGNGDDCAAGFSCTNAKCVPEFGGSCDGEHTITAPGGVTVDCTPYPCTALGTCATNCASDADCVSPALCDTARSQCEVPGSDSAPAVAVASDSGGCGCRVHAAPTQRTAAWALVAAMAMAVARVSRRKRTPGVAGAGVASICLAASCAALVTPTSSLAQTAVPSVPTAPAPGMPALATVLRTAQQRTLSSVKVALPAILLDSLGNPVSGKSIQFKVKVKPGGATAFTTSATTDAKGRAVAYFTTPSSGAYNWDVEVRFGGDSNHAAAFDTRTLVAGTNAHVGSVQVPQGPTVSIAQTDGSLGRRVQLRAHVSAGGNAPGGVVRFFLNGIAAGSATVDASGLARLGIAPSSAQLANFKKVGLHNWAGPVQAWYEPPVGSSLRASAGIGPAYIWENPAVCRIMNVPSDQRCSSASATPSSTTPLLNGIVTVTKGSFGQGQVQQKPKIRVSYASPPQPAPNPDCNASVISSGSQFCSTKCERLEYLAISNTSTLEALLGNAAANQASSCAWQLETELNVLGADLRQAHDRCTVAATQQNKQTWNHDVTITVKHRVAAAFRFRDPHTTQTSTGWKAHLTWQTVIRDGEVNVPLTVRCR